MGWERTHLSPIIFLAHGVFESCMKQHTIPMERIDTVTFLHILGPRDTSSLRTMHPRPRVIFLSVLLAHKTSLGQGR